MSYPVLALFALLASLFFLGNGLVALFAIDIAWTWTEYGNSIYGRTSERTQAWEFWTRVGGILCVFMGGGLAIWGLSVLFAPPPPKASDVNWKYEVDVKCVLKKQENPKEKCEPVK